jgi:3-oxoadipate enol-lactonase
MPFLKIGDCVHCYLDEGAKELPALLLANSLGTDLRIWDEVAARLVGHFRAIRYDKRGHGLTDAPMPPYSAGDLVKDVVGLLDALEVDQAVICGISVGGLIAQALALSHPERVRALVLCDTGARIGSVESWEQRIAAVRTSGLQGLESAMMERWFSKEFRERRTVDVRGYSNMLVRTTVDGYIGTCYALRDADFRQIVPRIKCKTLVLCGAQDIATSPELGQELARSIPGAEFSLIENAGHLSCIEQPEKVTGRMMQFFREVPIV